MTSAVEAPSFPAGMRSLVRWMVRVSMQNAKRPRSVLPEKPADYVPKEAKEHSQAWRSRWNQPCVWAPYRVAYAYWRRHPDKCEGLSFVLHPGDNRGLALRLICLDFDNAFDAAGELLPEVRAILDVFDGWVEYSRSGTGVHLFVFVQCVPFKNIYRAPVAGGCRVDVLCQAQVAVTGRQFEGYNDLSAIPYSLLESLPFFKAEEPDDLEGVSCSGWWDAPRHPLGEQHEKLAADIESWPVAIEGANRENIAFAAACKIARHGFTGWDAYQLLQLLPCEPPLTDEKLKHKAEDGYRSTVKDGTFGTLSTYKPGDEFDAVDSGPTTHAQAEPGAPPERRIYSLREFMALETEWGYLVEELLVDQQTLVIGGGSKCFKTGIAADLALSLAAGVPFFGRFKVAEPRSVLFYTAEIGLAPAQDLFRRILISKGLDQPPDGFWIDPYSVPQLTNGPGVGKFARSLDEYKPQVAVIDPLYFCMDGANAADLYSMATVLQNMARECSARGVWAIICHHSRKIGKLGDPFAPMTLSDLYGTGIEQFVRQWALVNHQSSFRGGRADLRIQFGGSATGDRYAWNLEINEGTADDAIDARKWEVNIERNSETEVTELATAEDVYGYIRSFDGRTEKQLRDCLELDPRKLGEILKELLDARRIVNHNGEFKVLA